MIKVTYFKSFPVCISLSVLWLLSMDNSNFARNAKQHRHQQNQLRTEKARQSRTGTTHTVHDARNFKSQKQNYHQQNVDTRLETRKHNRNARLRQEVTQLRNCPKQTLNEAIDHIDNYISTFSQKDSIQTSILLVFSFYDDV